MLLGLDVSARFWDKALPGPGCWLWLGALNRGKYGAFGVDGKTVYAHRFAYEQRVGPIPAGMDVDHLCRTTACVNPAHLEAVTPRVNRQRAPLAGAAKAHAAQTHCKGGHPFDGHNGRQRTCSACHRVASREYARRRALATRLGR